MAARRSFWLVKSEPAKYAWDDLVRDRSTFWDGVRNHAARNHLAAMKKGDLVLYYHSNASPPGVAGIAKVASEPYPDPTQFDRRSKYHDPKSSKDDPRWYLVDVAFVEKLPELLPLESLKNERALEGMYVTRRGMRLSVQPVDKKHFQRVLKMAGAKTKA